MTVEDIIRAAGGVGRLADALGVDHSTVSWWRRTGRLPARRIVSIATRFNVPLAEVAALSGDPPGDRAPTDEAG